MTQMGFFDLSDRYASLDAKKDPLVEIDGVVPWEEFRPALERIWGKPDADRKSRARRKPMDAVVMFKTLGLSALFNLSDDHIEYQARDRLSFMRFLGLRVEHIFGALANDMGGTLVRTSGMVRAKAKIGMKNLAYNMRRLCQLRRINPNPA